MRKLLPFMKNDNLASTEVKLTFYSQKILTDDVIESTLSPLTKNKWQSAIDRVMLALYMPGDLEHACRLRAFIHDRFPATIGRSDRLVWTRHTCRLQIIGTRHLDSSDIEGVSNKRLWRGGEDAGAGRKGTRQ